MHRSKSDKCIYAWLLLNLEIRIFLLCNSYIYTRQPRCIRSDTELIWMPNYFAIYTHTIRHKIVKSIMSNETLKFNGLKPNIIITGNELFVFVLWIVRISCQIYSLKNRMRNISKYIYIYVSVGTFIYRICYLFTYQFKCWKCIYMLLSNLLVLYTQVMP